MDFGPGRAELALELHASGAETSSGVSDAIDLADGSAYTAGCGARSLAYLDLDIATITGASATIAITIETSRDGNFWHAAPTGAFDAAAAAGWQRRAFLDLDRYVRARWTLSAGADVTFALVGSGLLVYAGLRHTSSLALRSSALADLTTEEIADALIAASDQADQPIGRRYQLPLVRWGLGISKHVASIASLTMMSARGYAPEPGQRDTWKDGYDRAIEFLEAIFVAGDPSIVAQLDPADFSTGGVNPPEREFNERGWAR